MTGVGVDLRKIVRIFARKILQKIGHLKSIILFHCLQFSLKVEYFVNKTETNTEYENWWFRPTFPHDQFGTRSSSASLCHS